MRERLTVRTKTLKQASKSLPPALQGILGRTASSGAISELSGHCDDMLGGLCLSQPVFTLTTPPTLPWQLCLLVHTTEAGGTCDPMGFAAENVWLRYPCAQTHVPVCAYVLTHIIQPTHTHTHIQKPHHSLKYFCQS